MYPLQSTAEKLNAALRSSKASFFFMSLSSCHNTSPAQDHKPLRRTLTSLRDTPVWETNENMCFALWQLMARC